MVQKTYEKHRKVLATVASTPQPVLSHLRQYAREFATEVGKLYTNKTYLAPLKGYLDWPRSKGGCRSALESRLKFSGGLRRLTTKTRIDPVCIFFNGPPGLGKSFLCSKIIQKLSKLFGYNYTNCYQRSIATEHWDGYKNQLICQIDDVFTKSDDEKDCSQIIQICSNADCVLPMADLKEKGRKFSSEFLVLSTNSKANIGVRTINIQEAILRRLSPSYHLKAFDKKTKLYTIGIEDPVKNWKEMTVLHLDQYDLIKYVIDNAITTYFERVDSLCKIDEVDYLNVFQPITNAPIGEYGYGGPAGRRVRSPASRE
jgi:hypothetical protein